MNYDSVVQHTPCPHPDAVSTTSVYVNIMSGRRILLTARLNFRKTINENQGKAEDAIKDDHPQALSDLRVTCVADAEGDYPQTL